MPIVPMSVPKPEASASRRIQDIRPPPSEPFALMAAAQMHSEGRLIPVANMSDFRKSDNIEDRRDESQLALKIKQALVGDNAMSEREMRNWALDQPSQYNNPLSKAAGYRDIPTGNQ